MIDQVITALGLELDLTSYEIADVLWLALQMQESDQLVFTDVSAESTQNTENRSEQRSRFRNDSFPESETREQETNKASQDAQAGLYNSDSKQNQQADFGSALTLRVPDARSLREPLSLARSLKPLLRRVTTGWSTVLDEAATVERIADEQIWMPVLKPALEPWLDLALVVDESVSMQIWQRTIAELQRLLEHYGVFRDVRVWGLITDEQGRVQVRPGIGAAARRQSARRPSELIDPSGRRLILIATDCVSSLWRDSSMLPALKMWASSGPMAIVQMLPEWLWSRTGLGFASAVRLHSLMPGVPNQQLVARDLSPWDEIDLEAGIKVPIVTLEPEPFIAWTQMVAGKGGAWSPGVVFEPEAQVSQVEQHPDLTTQDSAEQRVQTFRVTASPMARRLAGLLAAAPVISLPIVRIIQDRLLPESRQVHVAEVFLGGLLKPLTEVDVQINPDTVQYEFVDRVRGILLESMTTSDVLNVVDEVSKFIADRLGLSLETFIAVLRNLDREKDQKLVSQSRPFAVVAAQILRKLGGAYANFAKELEQSSTSYLARSDLQHEKSEQEQQQLIQSRLEAFRSAASNLSLSPLITVQDLARFGVDYQAELIDELEQAIKDCVSQDNKLIFTGHRGCGKSTLLAELGFRLTATKRYFVVMFSIADTIERSAVDHVNILFSMALQLLEAAEERAIKLKPGIKKEFYRWLGKHTQTESRAVEAEIEANAETTVKAGIPLILEFLAMIKSKLKLNSVIRQEISTEFARRTSDLVAQINQLQAYIENATGQEVFVIIDDLDKLDLSVTETIFSRNIQSLVDPNLRILYTLPVATLREVSIRTSIQVYVNKIHTMRVAKFFSKADVRKPDRIPDQSCVEVFEQILDRRLPPYLIEPDVKRQIILLSGGVLRELIRISDHCCDKAMQNLRGQIRRQRLDQPDVIVNQQILDKVVTELQIEYAEVLGQADFEMLKLIYEQFKPQDTENQRFLDLLHGLYVLEYRNALLWYDLNPIVAGLLYREGIIGD